MKMNHEPATGDAGAPGRDEAGDREARAALERAPAAVAAPLGTLAEETLAALRDAVARLADRVATLEQERAVLQARLAEATGPAQAPSPAPEAEGLSEEVVLAVAAAVAAYLGKKPRIRQIKLVGSRVWAQQGRATIQASHAPPLHHG